MRRRGHRLSAVLFLHVNFRSNRQLLSHERAVSAKLRLQKTLISCGACAARLLLIEKFVRQGKAKAAESALLRTFESSRKSGQDPGLRLPTHSMPRG